MKYLKKFNEGFISKLDIQNILDFFYDLKDEGYYFINKGDLNNIFYSPEKLELTYTTSRHTLDEDGNNYYQSKKRKFYSFDPEKDKAENLKNFNIYEDIVININIDNMNEKNIIEICNNIYSHLIGEGYNCQVWKPEYRLIRFHISTEDSNPFMNNKNTL